MHAGAASGTSSELSAFASMPGGTAPKTTSIHACTALRTTNQYALANYSLARKAALRKPRASYARPNDFHCPLHTHHPSSRISGAWPENCSPAKRMKTAARP